MHTGPWVVVAGMHRSGTSAIAGALGALGLQLPRTDDRVDWPESNPEHWESLSISRFDEDLLLRMGGTWDAPPSLPEGWERGPAVRTTPDPSPVVAAAYPEPGPLVWKDPRVCLLFPYWRAVLPGRPVVVFVWRSPLAVATSLTWRDGFVLEEGLALWERYNRTALEDLHGSDVYVVDYDRFVDEPKAFIDRLSSWLASFDQLAGHADTWEVDRAATVVADGLRHHHRSRTNRRHTLPEHHELADILSKLHGGHRPFAADPPPPESGWTTSLLQTRCESKDRARKIHTLATELEATGGELEGTRLRLEGTVRALENIRASTSWRVTMPLRRAIALTQRGSGPGPDSPGTRRAQ